MLNKLKSVLNKIKTFILKHKIITIVLIVILAGVVFWLYKSFSTGTVQTKYVLAQVEKGTIVSSLSSSGQVSVLNQIDIKSKASGTVVYVGAKKGQQVSAGQFIAQIDSRTAKQAVNDAQTNLEKAQLNLKKMQGITISSGTLRGDKEKAADDLQKTYDDGFNNTANTFLDIPSVISGLHGIIFDSTASRSQQNIDWYEGLISSRDTTGRFQQYKKDVLDAYNLAEQHYNDNFDYYKTISRESNQASIEKLMSDTYDTVKLIADSVKTTNNFLDYIKKILGDNDIPISAILTTHQSLLNNYTGTTNSHLSSLYSSKTTIQNNKEALINVDFDITDQEIAVKQAENSLVNAKETLSNYYIVAPFAGVLAVMNAKVGDTAPSTVATIVTKTLVAEISFGETDIAKVKPDQKATLTFDAVTDLTITGKVSEVDTIGTSSQGVVSYNVKIILDLQDERIKPGMSTSATVITATKTDALYVPNSAVKTQQGAHYVLLVSDSTSSQDIQIRQTVEIGLADDQSTEIVSGLKEGDIVVSSTVSLASATTTSSSTTNRNTGATFKGVPGL